MAVSPEDSPLSHLGTPLLPNKGGVRLRQRLRENLPLPIREREEGERPLGCREGTMHSKAGRQAKGLSVTNPQQRHRM